MEPLKAPTADDDALDLWKVVAKLVQRDGALDNLKVVTSVVRNKLTRTEDSATLEIMGGKGDASAAAVTFPWQPYLSPTATGAAKGRTIRINVGVVWDGTQLWLPSRRNLEIVLPANCPDGYFVWLVATVDAAGLLTSLDYDHGTSLPGAVALSDDDAAPPPTAYDLLFYVTTDATTATLSINNGANVLRKTPLTLRPVITNQTGTTTERRMFFGPSAALDDLPG